VRNAVVMAYRFAEERFIERVSHDIHNSRAAVARLH
jgi:hypothetical protein